jgi:hypothetical protein
MLQLKNGTFGKRRNYIMTLVTDKMEILERLEAMDGKFRTRVNVENAIIAEFNKALDRDINKDLDGTIIMKFVWFDCHQFVRDNPEIAKLLDFDLEEFINIIIEEYEEFGIVEEGYDDWVVGDAA